MSEKLFEEYTFEYILNKMLDNISDDIDKREGSVIYNAIAPCAMELSEMYKKLNSTINSVFIDTAGAQYLDNLTKQFGIERNPATHAIKKGIFYDNNNQLIDVEIGKRFSINTIIYSVYEKISAGIYQMQCETAGEIGNMQSGNLLPIDYIENLAIAELTDILIPAVDEESDNELRERFYDAVNSVAFGGNIADYKEKVKEIEGVGAIKVIPVWNGGGTVKLVILDDSYNSASDILIEKVQTAVGHNGNGIAPIGHVVTSVAAENIEIIVSTTVTLETGVESSVVKTAIKKALNDYFTEVKKEWENSTSLTVRIAHIESRILDVNGVLDVTDTLINGSTINLILSNEQVPYLSEVILNA